MEISLLKKVPIFAELDERDLSHIASMAIKQSYPGNSMILIEEESGQTLFIIITGKVKISRLSEDGREVILSILSEGDFFGEMSLLDGMARSANVISLDKSELLLLRRRDFLDLLQQFPTISISLLRELAKRIRKSDSQIKSLSLKNATGKVASTLLSLAEDLGTIHQGRVAIKELPLQQDLANMAGTSRETISRVIKNLIEQGYLNKEGNNIYIIDYERFKSDFS